MIESMTIKKVATCNDTGIQINDLKKVNFFFGYNGSGKSTIAKYIYNLSLEESQRNLDFKDCTQSGYNKTNHQILVFDDNFTEINFIQNPSLKGVFSLNEKNDKIDGQIASQESLIKYYKDLKEKKEKSIERINQDKSQKHTTLLEDCWTYRNTFSTFTKITLAYSGSKPNHLKKIKDVLQHPLVDIPTIEHLTEHYNLLYEKEITEITIMVNTKLYKEIRILEIVKRITAYSRECHFITIG